LPLFSVSKNKVEASDVQNAVRGPHLSSYLHNAANEAISVKFNNYFIPIRLKILFSYTLYYWQHNTHSIPRYTQNFRLLWPCIMNVGWRERNQQDENNLMFIIKLLSQHVSGIIMPIIRRTRVCTAAYGVLHWLWFLWLCGAGTRAVCTVKVTVRLSKLLLT